MDFNLSESTTEEINNLASVLGYYAFVVSKISDTGLNLGINFSAFALIVLFNDDIISKLTTILTKLQGFETTTNAKGNKRVNEYFQVEFNDGIPVYKPDTRKKEYQDIDKELEYLIGLFYAIEELYFPDDFTRELNTQIESQQYIPPFEELISLVSKYTHSSRDRFQSQANSEGDRMYNEEIAFLLSKLEKLEKLELFGGLFRNAYNDIFRTETYNLTINASGNPILNVDLFSLGQCINQKDDITSEAINKIIRYNTNESTPEHLTIVKIAINTFLEKYKEDKLMLFRFIKYITGSLSLPSVIDINLHPNPSMLIISHTCFKSLDVGINQNVSTSESLIRFLEVQISSDTGFGMAGGSRKTHTRSRKQYRKQSHKKSHKRIQKHNKNKISKRTRNNKRTGKKRN
jgi:hypothetical protein